MRFLCRIGWHEWGKWSQWYPVENRQDQILYIVQMRTCYLCGRTDTKHEDHPRP